jgi:hypothetical protein
MESNWVTYLIMFVIIAHFAVGFVFLVKKLSGPVPPPEQEGEQGQNGE